MADPTRTRRRHRPSSKAASLSAEKERFQSEIRSGGSSDNEDDDDGHHRDNTKYDRSSRNKYSRTKRRRRRKRRDDEPPFVVLVFQVGAVLMMLCLASFHVYRYISPSRATERYEEYDYVGDTSGGEDDDFDEAAPQGDRDDNNSKYRKEQELKLKDLLHKSEDEDENKPWKKDKQPQKEETQINAAIPPLPSFNLSKSSEYDAYGIIDKLKKDTKNDDGADNNSFWNVARDFREQFAELYGGENAARMLMDRGTTTFAISTNNTDDKETHSDQNQIRSKPPSDIVATACRLRKAKVEQRAFRMAFGGYSVTTGRGNKHQDSYPFQLQRILGPIMKAAGFVAPLSVTNAAIGGIPSFPYGWCMAEFWGVGNNDTTPNAHDIPDVVSWDFGMNEATGGPEGLEAYIRHLLSTYSASTTQLVPPKLIVKDYFEANQRKEVISEYSKILKDPIVLHTDHAVETIFDATKVTPGEDEDSKRPLGFRKWREWGAPKGAPGQAPHHPAVQEHKLNGWILAMHFVTALEYMMVIEEEESDESTPSRLWCPAILQEEDRSLLPPPVSRKIANNTKIPYDGIYFGYPVGSEKQTHESSNNLSEPWKMNPMRCRTTFEPKVSGNLSEIIVRGTVGENLKPTLPKSQYFYNRGWTFDLSDAEKSAKRKLNLYPDGLGFRDSKVAYYGIYESPPMELLLPYEGKSPINAAKVGDYAKDWYESIVLCQVNDKNTFDSAFKDPNSCNFEHDIGIRIGGVNITQNTTKMLNTIGSVYLGKPICKYVPIPSEARLTSYNTLSEEVQHGGQSSTSRGVKAGDGISFESKLLSTDRIGLSVEVFVSNSHIVHIKQACSLSHVIWEERIVRQ